MGIVAVAALAREGARRVSHDHSNPPTDQFGRHFGEAIFLAHQPAEFDRHVLALDEARFGQAFAERRHEYDVRLRTGLQVSDDGHRRRLLRPRQKRPSSRAAEPRDEIAPFHSITSSARPSRLSGNVKPSALAVFMLMTSSTFVICWTGRSAGLSPLRMRPV